VKKTSKPKTVKKRAANRPVPLEQYYSERPDGRLGLKRVGLRPICADLALTIPAYYHALSVYQRHIGQLPLITYKRQEDGGRERATDHPAYHVLKDRPNPAMSRRVYMELVVKGLLHDGEFFASIQRDGYGEVIGLFPIPRMNVMRVLIDQDWKKAYIVNTAQGTEAYTDDEMIHLFLFSHCGIRGVNVIDYYAAESLGLHRQVLESAGAFFENAARPHLYVSYPGRLTPATLKTYKEGFDKEHKGTEKTGESSILGEGGEIKVVDATTAQDAQILEALNAGDRTIGHLFNMAPAMLGDLSDVHYNSLAAENMAFYGRSILPLLSAIEDEHSYKVFGLDSDYYCEFLVEQILRASPDEQADIFQKYAQMGALQPNEIREKLNYPKLPGIDNNNGKQQQPVQDSQPSNSPGAPGQ
jgi:HK97 family phage portal protein